MGPRFSVALMGLKAVLLTCSLVHSAIFEKTYDGKLVSVSVSSEAGESKLTMTDTDGKNERTYMVGTSAKVTIDGKQETLNDLKKGDAIKVTLDNEGKVIEVAATRSNATSARQTEHPKLPTPATMEIWIAN